MGTHVITPVAGSQAVIVPLSDQLTHKQKLFVYHYLDCGNATEAALLAGYSGTRKALSVVGSQNLAKIEIRSAIDEFHAQRILSPSSVLGEISSIATVPIKDLRTAAKPAPIDASDKLKALELLGKHHKLFTDKIELDTQVDPKRLAGELVSALLELRKVAQQPVLTNGNDDDK